ncbi:hypothetical protein [Ligilactobacillus salivarius]|uniref:Uncharacterized protein n=1 Tax=Ligilactobacillus salivarius TaxID=1624 RepID=A0A9X6XID1_9LACO|nr:hypothetical protein [Ligilactobacillus salivarius]MDY5444960.1 hypothetical protein [Lactobacillus amylovorus]MBE5066024.1 hypothetical protein [Ligilactobacillus salivarius]MBE7387127.1 hypothetical protein [Ligilactobacillus salivarius]MBE7391469.1 hypothetical protein [Ligilactobacillus salivarius]MBL1070100.1 hypothetical protein [Ligilactobacillus salivarius]
MKKIYNWLKKDDNLWLTLVILGILAIIIGVVFFWDWFWAHILKWIIIYFILKFIFTLKPYWYKE